MFFVFNPLDIKDKTHVTTRLDDVEGLLTDESIKLIDSRTVERDYRFIAQSDAVVVIYPTDKLSPGVFAEMRYAYSHQIPVLMLFLEKISPFLDEIAEIYQKEEEFFEALTKLAENDDAFIKQNNLAD